MTRRTFADLTKGDMEQCESFTSPLVYSIYVPFSLFEQLKLTRYEAFAVTPPLQAP